MANQLQNDARHEAEWVQQYSRLYRQRMADLIDRVNRTLAETNHPADPAPARPVAVAPAPDTAGQSIRCCLEAVDLMLSSQAEFAQVIDRWATTGRGPKASANRPALRAAA